MEQLAEGLLRAYDCDGQIVIFRLTNMTRKTLDVWYEACQSYMRQCLDEQRPSLILQDYSSPNMALTPYFGHHGQLLTNSYPELSGRTAILLPSSLEAHRLRLYLMKSVNKNTRQRNIFATQGEALRWLKQVTAHPCDDES